MYQEGWGVLNTARQLGAAGNYDWDFWRINKNLVIGNTFDLESEDNQGGQGRMS
jgi:hypothetical protein